MGETTKIAWCDATFNPWRGCQKVSPGCAHCYAETFSHRNPKVLGEWGPNGTRVVAAESHWRQPLKWNRDAQTAGVRRRVFCASLADVFEDWKGPMSAGGGATAAIQIPGFSARPMHLQDVRVRLLRLICDTPHLDWLLLTKRPLNVLPMLRDAWMQMDSARDSDPRNARPFAIPDNVWIGASVENQAAADERIPHLLKIPARVRFLSVEPLLGPIDLVGWGEASPLVSPSSLPERWSEFAWLEWVPEYERKIIEEFWGETTYGRSPRQWMQDHYTQKVPHTGASVAVRLAKSGWGEIAPHRTPGADLRGRYLHCWNNIGRVVCDDGRVVPVSSCQGTGWLSKWLQPDGSYKRRIDWAIIGGESGPNARRCYDEWVHPLVRQCRDAGTAVFVKQMGSVWAQRHNAWRCSPLLQASMPAADAKGGNPEAWPESLRIREFPRHG